MLWDNLYLSLLLLFFTGEGWPGLPLLIGHWGALGGQSGLPLLLTAYLGRDRDLVKVLCLYVVSHYSPHLPAGDGCFLGRRGEGGELVLGLLWPHAGGLNHLPGVDGHWRGSDCSGWLLEISGTTGGRSARGMQAIAAASGGSAPTSIETSGNAARGGVWTGSDLSLTATGLTSLKGSVKCQFLFKARQGDPEK